MKYLLLLLLLEALDLRGAIYYVDYSGGSDAANGTSTATPWKHSPGDTNATGSALSTTLSAGDSVIFKGGVSYLLVGSGDGAIGISLNWSGTIASPITYDGNSSGAWGTGRAIMTDNYLNTNGLMFCTTGNRSNLVFKNIEFGPMGGSASLPPDTGTFVNAKKGTGISLLTKSSGIRIQDCWFHNLGYHWNQKPMTNGSIDGFGIYSVNAHNLTVTNNTFNRMHTAVEVLFDSTAGSTNVVIVGNDFFDSIVWCVDYAVLGASPATQDRLSIMDNKFHDYYQLDSGAWTGYGEWPHTDGIFMRLDPGPYATIYGTNNNIYRNSFYSTNSTGGGTADIYVTEGPSVNIYNNIWRYSGKGRLVDMYNSYEPGSQQIVNIYNNSFLITFTPAVDIEGPGYNSSIINVVGNSFYDTQTGSGANFCVYLNSTNVFAGLTFNYNSYKSFNTGGKYFNFGGGEYDVSGLRATSYHWESNGISGDPLYMSISSFATPLSANLSPQTLSPLLNSSTNLTSRTISMTGIDKDYNGTMRLASGNWAIGAYEFVQQGVAYFPASPRNRGF